MSVSIFLAVFGVTLFLAYANGANDNFKGVATLYGSGSASYRTALVWATITTLAGSLAAIFIAQELITLFTGKGLIANALVAAPAFLIAVVLSAGVTVFTTARLGIPISTTHALIGGLAGAGLVADFNSFQFSILWHSFLFPLATAPLVPVLLIGAVYPIVRWVVLAVLGFFDRGSRMFRFLPSLAVASIPVGITAFRDIEDYPPRPRTDVIGARSPGVARWARAMEILHFLSAGAVGFARGLNDTPKIVALLLTASALDVKVNIGLIAVAMALGGLLHARKIAETMANKITTLSPGQGTLANVVTSLLVIFASKFGMPVSTTHVSVGAITGIGLIQGKINWRLLAGILSAWFLTMPIAMVLSAILYRLALLPSAAL